MIRQPTFFDSALDTKQLNKLGTFFADPGITVLTGCREVVNYSNRKIVTSTGEQEHKEADQGPGIKVLEGHN